MEAVLSVPIAVGFGYWADTHFETSPRYLLLGAVIGFSAFVVRLTRMRPGADEKADAHGENDDERTDVDPAKGAKNGKREE
jgi:F0F1-type ATP synthase assembly protein I